MTFSVVSTQKWLDQVRGLKIAYLEFEESSQLHRILRLKMLMVGQRSC